MKNPLQTLDKLAQLTRETLVLELASLGTSDRRKAGLSRWQSWIVGRLPVILVGSRGAGKNFYFTRSGIRNLLKARRHDFARVELTDSEFKNRFLVIAHRRRINYLVVVGGPTSAGKSTLIGRLQAGRLPVLGGLLGVSNLFAWPDVTAHSIDQLEQPDLDGLIFHCDFTWLFGATAGMYEQANVLDIFESARTISFVTLWTPPERLEQQFYEGDLARSRSPKRKRDLLDVYRQPSQVVQLYRRWFEFCDREFTKTRKHIIVELNQELTLYTREEWERVASVK